MPNELIRTATLDDVPAMAAADAASWPEALVSDAEQIAARIAVYPAGQLVAVVDGVVCGAVYAQRLSEAFFTQSPKTYRDLTDDGRFTRTHSGNGEIYQMFGVSVLPEQRGSGLGRRLVDCQIEQGRSLQGIQRILGFTRPARYHRRREMPIEDYVRAKDDAGRWLDPVLAFHFDAGARFVSVHPGYRPEDVDTCGYAVLIEYDV